MGSSKERSADTETALPWAPRSDAGDDHPAVVVVFSEIGAPLGAHPLRERCQIGRDEESAIALDDAKVSRAHAVVTRGARGVEVADLGSRNGTFLQGRAVGSAPVAAPPGSVLRVGRSVLLIAPSHARLAAYPGGSRPPVIGGPALDPVREAIAEVAPSRAPVLIDGETGAGKEVAARLLHERSARSGQMVTLNCASLPGELAESELFGHRRGSFSGSDQAREGLFRRAHGGTLFLDEIGELPLELQAKLLRVLDSGEVRALGEDAPAFVDVRVVAATNRDPEEMVERGTLRADLFHRLAALRVTVPPLRERREDIPLLVRHFLPSDVGITAIAVEQLLLRDWPGNVRELGNTISVAVARVRAADEASITPDHLVEPRRSARPAPARSGENAAEVGLRARIETALSIRGGNMAQVARDLGMGRSTLYEAIERLGIDPSAYRR